MHEKIKQMVVRRSLKNYLKARQKLRRLGVIRAERSVVGEYAERYVAQTMGLKLASSTVNADFDATDLQGKTYQIKARLIATINETTSFDFKNKESEFDYFVAVLLNAKSLQLIEKPVVLPRSFVEENWSKNDGSNRLRWNSKLVKKLRDNHYLD